MATYFSRAWESASWRSLIRCGVRTVARTAYNHTTLSSRSLWCSLRLTRGIVEMSSWVTLEGLIMSGKSRGLVQSSHDSMFAMLFQRHHRLPRSIWNSSRKIRITSRTLRSQNWHFSIFSTGGYETKLIKLIRLLSLPRYIRSAYFWRC